jgi:hydrogenase maturation protease
MGARVVLFGYGNPSRGDDALGPALLACAEVWLGEHRDATVRLVEGFQLQVEDALDLADADLVLFVDASASGPAPFSLQRVTPARDASYTTHELSPAALLQVARDLTGTEPPPSWVLAVRGEQFALGDALSASAAAHLDAAWNELQVLLADASASAWQARLTAS